MEKKVYLLNNEIAFSLFGQNDKNINIIEDKFDAKLFSRGNELIIKGNRNSVEKVFFVIEELLKLIKKGNSISKDDIDLVIRSLQDEEMLKTSDILTEDLSVSRRDRHIKPKTLGQKKYVEAIIKYDIVFGIGPAGTGKTYLAMAMAVSSLKNKEVDRIILVRPAVEAGENLGFLPGSFSEKVDPYLRPLYDAIYDMMEIEKVQRLMDKGIIEVAPLAYMRGRTLNNAFIILDEAQNTTSEQMKMFLTRLGFNSKTVITGDITQVDLPSNRRSGLIEIQEILKDIEGISFVYFNGNDVVRHELVQKIIEAYAQREVKR
ncbi:MAG: PhoH family protein [bacterium]|nr:PhoH family protein [bacterium]